MQPQQLHPNPYYLDDDYLMVRNQIYWSQILPFLLAGQLSWRNTAMAVTIATDKPIIDMWCK